MTEKVGEADMYRIAVCEDEAIFRDELCAQCGAILTDLHTEYTISAFSSAAELENALSEGASFSLLCLDIMMQGKNGMQLARELREHDEKTSVLFITSSAEFLKDGYSVRPIQYLFKPVQYDELAQAIQVDLRLYHRPNTVSFRVAGRTLVLPVDDILYAESRNHGTVLHTTGGEQFLSCPLSQTEEVLPRYRFCRCHNSFLVNFSHIRELSGRTLHLIDGGDLNIGRRYMKDFQNRFVRYLNRI